MTVCDLYKVTQNSELIVIENEDTILFEGYIGDMCVKLLDLRIKTLKPAKNLETGYSCFHVVVE